MGEHDWRPRSRRINNTVSISSVNLVSNSIKGGVQAAQGAAKQRVIN